MYTEFNLMQYCRFCATFISFISVFIFGAALSNFGVFSKNPCTVSWWIISVTAVFLHRKEKQQVQIAELDWHTAHSFQIANVYVVRIFSSKHKTYKCSKP